MKTDAIRDGRVRTIIESVTPSVDGGRFAAKRIVGDTVTVEADIYADGHDVVVAVLRHRHCDEALWNEAPMCPLGNDRWHGEFAADRLGNWEYTIVAWVDAMASWRSELARRVDPADIGIALEVGAALIDDAARRADIPDAATLRQWALELRSLHDTEKGRTVALDEERHRIAMRHADRTHASTLDRALPIVVEPLLARCSTWYEMFPRSASPHPGRHGTLRDCVARLPYVAGMGFDVLYLPPVHPIGRVRRKGRNNALAAGPDDVGSPWAIGAAEGGHLAVHPELGTIGDFDHLVIAAKKAGIAIALDIALQCAPDHPWVEEHPEWFRHRPDGSVQYAENPPKKYEDIYPFHFESDAWSPLWDALNGIFDFWIAHGVTVFRVDNPHSKPFAFWEWAIAEIRRDHPEVVFLAEAFTRPRIMHRLAKLGFTQSYTYFAWRNTKLELTSYFQELAHGPGREYFRPNVWPNTPDILTEYLQHGGRPAFCARLLLAATLSANYGIYGPAFELTEAVPASPGSEEYLDSEKYEIRHRDIERPDSMCDFISHVNRIRRENVALQRNDTLLFADTDNDQLIAYSRYDPDASNLLVMVVNLDPHHRHTGWLTLDTDALGIDPAQAYKMHDLMTGARYLWHGPRNFVDLGPGLGHVFRVGRRLRSERDFDYYY